MLGGRTSPRLIPAPMDIALTHRLSFKQASLTVLVAFILGTLLSLIQVGVDYASQDASINREVRALLDVSHNPAARIAYNIDAELAQELVLGLLRSPAVVRAEIIDTSGLPLASASREPAESRLRPLSDFLFGHKRVYEDPLHVDHAPGEALGVLQLEIDTFVFGNDFLRRAGITLLSGFVRSLLLSLILLVLFYTLLTKPLVSLIQALSGHDPRSPARMRLPCPKGHERDEIGVLVEVINRQLGRISVEIEQRREAENRLTQYLEELESIVAARTAELKAANARLTLSNQELEEARQTALDMAQARASFLANMSHEIRTPLNGLLGMLSLSLDGPLTPEQRQQLSIAHDSGKVLVELLNDVLDLSKFEAGQLVLEQIPFDLGVLVEDTASLLSQNAAAGVELTCLVDPALPAPGFRRPDADSPGRQQPAVQRAEVHPPGAGRRSRGSHRRGCAHQCARHRHRHRPGGAGSHLPTVHPGRRGYHPPIRRHRPRPGPHAQAVRGHAGRTDGGVDGRPGQPVQRRPAAGAGQPSATGAAAARPGDRAMLGQQRAGAAAANLAAAAGAWSTSVWRPTTACSATRSTY
ncbi:sensor/response regulator hybrid [Pseudomonas aeruginosa]|nr:sensor/response regulator hybrid [Pseudomonas aeruginosa]